MNTIHLALVLKLFGLALSTAPVLAQVQQQEQNPSDRHLALGGEFLLTAEKEGQAFFPEIQNIESDTRKRASLDGACRSFSEETRYEVTLGGAIGATLDLLKSETGVALARNFKINRTEHTLIGQCQQFQQQLEQQAEQMRQQDMQQKQIPYVAVVTPERIDTVNFSRQDQQNGPSVYSGDEKLTALLRRLGTDWNQGTVLRIQSWALNSLLEAFQKSQRNDAVFKIGSKMEVYQQGPILCSHPEAERPTCYFFLR